jgi:hypothetical protein
MSSDEFYEAFCHSGSAIQTCECGRTFYCDTPDVDLTDKERYRLQNDPNAIETDDFTRWFQFAGQQIVFDCPCKKDEAIEQLLWNHRHDICAFFKNKVKKNGENQKRDEEMIDGL